MQCEVNSTHDSVTKLLMDDCLQGHAIYLHDFIETIDQRVSWYYRSQPLRRKFNQLGCHLRIKPQCRRQLLRLLSRRTRLAVKQSGDPHFITVENLFQVREG